MASEETVGSSAQIESFALKLSMAGYLFVAVTGVAFALLTRSEAIMLDGVYSLVSFVMAILAGQVARVVEKPASETFHFGYAHFEPLLNAVRGLLVLLICSFGFVSAIDALLHGGRSVSPGLAVLYCVCAAIGCLVLAAKQRQFSRKVGSPLLAVDARHWLVDGIVSSGVGLTFLVAFLLERTAWKYLVPYVDPVLVIVLVAALIRMPVMTVRANLLELMQVAPEKDDQREVRDRVEAAVDALPTRKLYVNMVKIGRFFYVMVHVILPAEYRVERIEDLDDVRLRIFDALRDIPLRLVVDTVFTAQERWAIGIAEQEGQEFTSPAQET